jgi:hypothetical protein
MRSKIWPLILILPLAFGFVGCGGDDDDSNPINHPPATTGTVSGIVSTLGGSSLGDVSVSIGSGTPVQTNEQGFFVMSGVAAGNVVVTFAVDGYVPTYRVVTVLANQTTHLPDVALMNVVQGTVDGAAGGSVDAGVSDVTFPANAFVNENGTPYTGEVHVEMAAMQPQTAGFFAAFPGEFEGLRDDGTTVPFVSFGIADVNLLNADKSAPVRLADGVTAELTMDVAPTQKASAPATIPMWYFDPATGRWIEDGTATLDGNLYVADVEHFTTWNWDMPVESICQIQGVVEDAEGNPVLDARVFSQGVQSGIMDEAYTSATGAFSVRGLAGEGFQVWAMKGSYVSNVAAVTLTDCPYAMTTVLELLEPAFSITLTWGQAPSDLDSHLWIPQPGTDPYHIWYPSYARGSLTEDPYTWLDTDCQTGYGPEVISSFHLYEGRYEYFVDNYSENTSFPLVDSGAVINLAVGNQTRTYAVANAARPDEVGVWHVFDLVVAANQAVTIVDVMTFEDPHNVGKSLPAPKR